MGYGGEELETTVKPVFVNGIPDQISVDLQQLPGSKAVKMSELLWRCSQQKGHEIL